MGVLVAKFGGSSLADSQQFIKVKEILFANEERRYVVPSAPGRRFSKDTKVTDLLYTCYEQAQKGLSCKETFSLIKARYEEIITQLGLSIRLDEEFDTIQKAIDAGASSDYAASRGEYLCGKVLSAFLNWAFVDAKDVVFFDEDGRFDAEKTQSVLSRRLAEEKNAVIPGFYGSLPNGEIKTFSRGGSDITGAIVARAVNARIYENWTDVDGFLMTDPRIVPNPAPISIITYRELRELSYMGAAVMHEEAIFPVRVAGIPINIRNTNNPSAPGTMIVANADASRTEGVITGVAGHKGYLGIYVDKNLMNSELGFGRRVLSALEDSGISFEHLPTGIDTMTVILSEKEIEGKLDQVISNIRNTCHPDHLEVIYNLCLIATVGRGMVRYPGSAAKLFSALSEAGINIRMIDQGSSEINIIVAVDEADFERAIRAIYDKFAPVQS